jgi:hypothetical protein
MQGAFDFLQNVEGKDLMMRELKNTGALRIL